MFNIYGEYFAGNKISEYGLQHNRLDYGTLAKSFNAVLCNDIFKAGNFEDWELISGQNYDEETDQYIEEFQYYIVDSNGAETLQEINENVYYNYELNMYVWGVNHYGTSWDYVLTDIECNTGEC